MSEYHIPLGSRRESSQGVRDDISSASIWDSRELARFHTRSQENMCCYRRGLIDFHNNAFRCTQGTNRAVLIIGRRLRENDKSGKASTFGVIFRKGLPAQKGVAVFTSTFAWPPGNPLNTYVMRTHFSPQSTVMCVRIGTKQLSLNSDWHVRDLALLLNAESASHCKIGTDDTEPSIISI